MLEYLHKTQLQHVGASRLTFQACFQPDKWYDMCLLHTPGTGSSHAQTSIVVYSHLLCCLVQGFGLFFLLLWVGVYV